MSERLSKGPRLKPVLDEFGNSIDRAFSQVCSLMNNLGGDAFDTRYRRPRPPAATTASSTLSGAASASAAPGRGFAGALAARR